jgi:hypothetical protein
MNKLIIVFLLAVVSFGCKKRDSESSPEDDYISKVLTTIDAVTDTVSYEFNRLNQLSRIVFDERTSTRLEYYQNGELAITTSYYVLPTSPETKVRDRLVLTYDAARKLQSGVLKKYINGLLVDIIHIEYSLNDKGQVAEYTTDDPEISGEAITYNEQGNIATTESDGAVKSYTYNDKKSCFSNALLKYYIGVTYLPVDLFNKNDLVKCVESANGVQRSEEFATEYTALGRPGSSTIQIVEPGLTNTEKRSYEYVPR